MTDIPSVTSTGAADDLLERGEALLALEGSLAARRTVGRPRSFGVRVSHS